MRRARRESESKAPARILIFFCALAISLSLWSIWQEAQVSAYQTRLDQEALTPPGKLLLSMPDLQPSAPARAYLAKALYIARAVDILGNSAEHRALLTIARQSLDHIDAVRPHWGEVWLVKAYVQSLSAPNFTVKERDALGRSYLDAPYLHDAGRWRVVRALAHWNAFSPHIQIRIAKEAAWLIRSGAGYDRAQILSAAHESDGYRPIYRELRRAAR